MFEANFQISLFFNLLLLIVALTFFYLKDFPRNYYKKPVNCFLEILFCVSVILLIGLRDWESECFGDSVRYGNGFKVMDINVLSAQKDYGFALFTFLCKKIMDIHAFFLFCAILYVLPLYWASKRISNKYSYYIFLFCVSTLSFFSYGTNGIRNGIATSLLFLAFTYPKYSLKQISIFILASTFHLSLLLPVFSYLVSLKYRKTKVFIYIWIASICISFLMGSAFKEFFLQIDFLQERTNGYLSGTATLDKFSMIGFRWDFLLYSSVPIFIGYYFVLKKRFTDTIYTTLLNTYILSNTIWVLIIDVPFSNRFAYLSWFLMPLLIIYPLLKYPLIMNRPMKIALSLTLYFGFTYLMV